MEIFSSSAHEAITSFSFYQHYSTVALCFDFVIECMKVLILKLLLAIYLH